MVLRSCMVPATGSSRPRTADAMFPQSLNVEKTERSPVAFFLSRSRAKRRVSPVQQSILWSTPELLETLSDDGLLPPGTDLAWLIDTTAVLVAAETYLLVTRMRGWDLDAYEAWVAATLTRLLAAAGEIPALPDPELVDEGSPHRVVLVVADPAGQEVDLVRGNGGNPDRQVGDGTTARGPARPARRLPRAPARSGGPGERGESVGGAAPRGRARRRPGPRGHPRAA